jgi:hypothetical protein
MKKAAAATATSASASAASAAAAAVEVVSATVTVRATLKNTDSSSYYTYLENVKSDNAGAECPPYEHEYSKSQPVINCVVSAWYQHGVSMVSICCQYGL